MSHSYRKWDAWGEVVHPGPPTQLNQGPRHTRTKDGINMVTTLQAGHDNRGR